MGFFYKETRSTTYTDATNNYSAFEAFPIGTIPLSALGYDEHKALKNSDIWTAVTLLSNDLSKLDIRVKDKGVYKDKDRIELLLNRSPNPYYNGTILKKIVIMNALLTGHGYIKIERNPTGQAFELYHVKTSQLQLKDSEDGGYHYELNTGNGKTVVIDYKDIIDIKPFTLDGINALRVLDALNDDLNTQKWTRGFFNKFFANGGQNSGILELKDGKLNQADRNKIRDEFTKANSGENNTGKVLVLDETMNYKQLEIDSGLLDIINKNQTPTKAIAKAFQIPLSKFGVEQPNTSLKDANNDYLNSCLVSYMKTIESELNFKLIDAKDQYNKEFKFDLSTFKQADWEAYTEGLRADLNAGAITHDEYRVAIGREPYPNGMGEKPRYDLNHISAEVADSYQLRQTSTNNQTPKPNDEDIDSSEGGDISE